MISRIKIIVIVFFFVCTTRVSAQAIFDTLLLNELEVIASMDDFRSPTKVTTIDSLTLKNMMLHDIGELLSSFSPVYVKSYGKGAIATVSFRGTGASHTKVIWEGFNINSPMLGQTDFSTIPVSAFNNIELLYGGSSLTETGGALGGSIKLGNQTIDNSETVCLTQSIGSFNTFLSAGTVNLKGEIISSRTHFTRQSSANDFNYLNTAILPEPLQMQQTNADYVNYGFTQQLDFKITKSQTITVTSWNQWNDRKIPEIMTNTESGGEHKETQSDFFSRNVIRWTYNAQNTSLESRAGYFHENLKYNLKTSDTLGRPITEINSDNQVKSYLASANLNSQLSEKLILKAGIKYLNQIVISNNYLHQKKRILISNQLGLSYSPGMKLTSEFLIRSEISDGNFTPIMPMLGINYKPLLAEELYLRLNMSRNYNLPSLNDLYWYPGGNDSLIPEQSFEAEISGDYSFSINKSHRIILRSTAYCAIVENWIVWMPSDYRYWSPQNIASVLSRGMEISLKSNGKIGFINYNIFVEYARTRTTDHSQKAIENGSSDIQLIYVPANSLNSFLSFDYNGYYANWGIHFTGQRNTSMNNVEEDSYILPPYTLNNFSIGKRGIINKSKYEIRLKIYNIFNVDYQAVLWRAMPGRNFEISMSLKI